MYIGEKPLLTFLNVEGSYKNLGISKWALIMERVYKGRKYVRAEYYSLKMYRGNN